MYNNTLRKMFRYACVVATGRKSSDLVARSLDFVAVHYDNAPL